MSFGRRLPLLAEANRAPVGTVLDRAIPLVQWLAITWVETPPFTVAVGGVSVVDERGRWLRPSEKVVVLAAGR